MGTAQECEVTSLPAIVTLKDPRVHVSGPDGSDRSAKIKGVIYQ